MRRALLGVDAAQQRGVPRLVLARRLVEVRVRRRGVAAGGHVVAAAHGRGHGGAVGGGHGLLGRRGPARRGARPEAFDALPAGALRMPSRCGSRAGLLKLASVLRPLAR